ncbi:MAG: hypothetical protein QXE81_01505 [Desulfurococcaceae archaeon]
MLLLVLLALLVAIANVLDIFTDVIGIKISKINPVQLGVLNSISYVVYIMTILIAGRLSDRGLLKFQSFIILIGLSIYLAVLNGYVLSGGFGLLITMYLLYPVLQSFTRTTTIAFIHENFQSNVWERLLSRRVVYTLTMEAILLITMSRFIEIFLNKTYLLVMFFTIPALTSFTLIRDPVLRFERTLFRIEVGVKRIENIVIDITTFSLLTNGKNWNRNRVKTLQSRSGFINVRKIIYALVCFKLSNAFLFTQLPIYLAGSLQLTSMEILSIYGFARLLLLVDFLINVSVSRRTYLLMFLRGLLPLFILGNGFKVDVLMLALVIGLLIYLNNKIEISLYSMYIDSIGRAETTRYLFVSELSSLASTMISGLVFSFTGYNGIIYITMSLLILGGFITRY